MHRFLLVSLQIAADAAFKNSQHVTSQATSPVKRVQLHRTDRAEKITADWGCTNEHDRGYEYPNIFENFYILLDCTFATLSKFKKLFLTKI